MTVLAKSEIEKHLISGQLISNPRKTKSGHFDVQPASYDLMAGRAVWKDPVKKQLEERCFDATKSHAEQATVCLQPGQMLALITHEELTIPVNMCATVFSKNNLALKGIFAFNAGHVDPGFNGPIVIRLINLRATPFTITLGQSVFTIVFHHLQYAASDAAALIARSPISMDATIKTVREFADVALSNALFDLYADAITSTLSDHRRDTLAAIQESLTKDYVTLERLRHQIFVAIVVGALACLAAAAAATTIARYGWPALSGLLQ
jgi:deoxycytidine triphosphate deaminase